VFYLAAAKSMAPRSGIGRLIAGAGNTPSVNKFIVPV
jgi:hypothetical protein